MATSAFATGPFPTFFPFLSDRSALGRGCQQRQKQTTKARLTVPAGLVITQSLAGVAPGACAADVADAFHARLLALVALLR